MKKIISLDFMKLFMACLIVAIHVYPFVSISEEFDYFFTHVFCRIGVPFFLMTTGYFVLDRALKDSCVLKKYLFKILKLYGICMALYFPINLYAHTFEGMGILEILKTIFLNGTFYHLWYFPALLLGLIIIFFLLKYIRNKNIVFLIVMILYFIGLFGDSYYGAIQNISVIKTIYDGIFLLFDYTRNGIFYVPIFLFLGYFIKTSETSMSSKNSFFAFLIFLGLMFVEGAILHYLGWQRHDSMYLFLISVMYFGFSFVSQVSSGNYPNIRNISTIIYVIHPLIIIGVRVLSRITNLEILVTHSVVNYFSVLFFSIVFSLLFHKCKQYLHF